MCHLVRLEGVIMKNRIRELRIKAGLTQEQLTEKASCSVRAIRYYESGKRVPDVNIARRIATTLNSTVEDLFGIVPDTTIISCY